jgi:hypothetical protein
MPLTKSAVELFISSKVTAVTECGASDIRAKHVESAHWLTTFGMAVIFSDFPPDAMRPFALNFVRRMHAAFLQYGLGREALLDLLKDGDGRWSPYYSALSHFEIAISQLYLALDSIRKLTSHEFFRTGDGSFEECLNLLYNSAKHELASSDVPIWLTNDGVECARAKLSFVEIEDFMSTMAAVAAGLSDRQIAMNAVAVQSTSVSP